MESQLLYPFVNIPRLGNVQGVVDDDHLVAKFLNVPVATIPERWRPAIEAEPWEGVYDATKPGHLKPQQSKNNIAVSITTSMPKSINFEGYSEEDFLGCDIYMPASAIFSTETLPVMVYVVGGLLKYGGSSLPANDCTDLVRGSIECNKPIIVVALNYRVNYFGFLSSKELLIDAHVYADKVPYSQKRWYNASVGNWGLLDVAMGLQWVQKHIAAFSGDPKNVTAMGQSAGSSILNYLQLIPEFHGLYRRCILQSCFIIIPGSMRIEDEAQAVFDDLCERLNIPAGLDPLEKVSRLRNVPVKIMAEVLNNTPVMCFEATVDNVLFDQHSYLSISETPRYDPNLEWVMTGGCSEEGNSLLGSTGCYNLKKWEGLKTRVCTRESRAAFDNLYGIPATDEDVPNMASRVLTDGVYHVPNLIFNEALLKHPTCQLSRFHFDSKIQKLLTLIPGYRMNHNVDLFYILGSDYARQFMNDEEKKFIRTVQSIWLEFVTAKSPQKSSLPLASKKNTRNYFGYSYDRTEKEAIVLREDLTIGRTKLERLSPEIAQFWMNSYAYPKTKMTKANLHHIGFPLVKGEKLRSPKKAKESTYNNRSPQMESKL